MVLSRLRHGAPLSFRVGPRILDMLMKKYGE